MGITDPSEIYFKNGLWGYHASSTAWKKLLVDDNDYLKVANQTPISGFATSANQTTIITALQLIDDLQKALTSIHTDSLDVRLDGQTADVEVKQQTAADLTPGIMGWDGSAWRKLGLVWGLSSVYKEYEVGSNVSAGNITLTFTQVGADIVRVIQGWTAWSTQASASRADFYLYTGVGDQRYCIRTMGVGLKSVSADVPIVLVEDDQLKVVFIGCATNDDIYSWAWGYDMAITE